ncbi:MAG: CHAT domain-containing protein [Candidatus Rhabdochlamydia sp.]
MTDPINQHKNKILTGGGFSKIGPFLNPDGHSSVPSSTDAKIVLYLYNHTRSMEHQKAKDILQRLSERNYSYEGDVEDFKTGIEEKPYLLKLMGHIFLLSKQEIEKYKLPLVWNPYALSEIGYLFEKNNLHKEALTQYLASNKLLEENLEKKIEGKLDSLQKILQETLQDEFYKNYFKTQEIYCILGDFSNQITYLEKCLKVASTDERKRECIYLLIRLNLCNEPQAEKYAYEYYGFNSLSENSDVCYLFIGMISLQSHNVERAEIYLNKYLKSQFISSDIKKIEKRCNEIIDNCFKVGNYQGIITLCDKWSNSDLEFFKENLIIIKGFAYGLQGDLSNEKLCYQERSSELSQGLLYTNQANFHENLVKYDEAKEYALKALKILEEIEASSYSYINLMRGTVYNSLGIIYWRLNNLSESLIYYNKYLKAAQGFKEEEIKAYNHIGIYYDQEVSSSSDDQKNFDLAEKNYNLALQITEELNNKIRRSEIYHNLGMLFYKKSDYSKSIDYHTKGLNLFTDPQDVLENFASYAELGRAYSRLGKIYSAQAEGAKPSSEDEASFPEFLRSRSLADYNYKLAEKHLRQSIVMVDQLLEQANLTEWKVCLFEKYFRPYRYLEFCFLQQPKTDEALEILDRRRALTLASLISKKSQKITPLTVSDMKKLAKELNTTFITYTIDHDETDQGVTIISELTTIYAWIITGQETKCIEITPSKQSEHWRDCLNKADIFENYPYLSMEEMYLKPFQKKYDEAKEEGEKERAEKILNDAKKQYQNIRAEKEKKLNLAEAEYEKAEAEYEKAKASHKKAGKEGKLTKQIKDNLSSKKATRKKASEKSKKILDEDYDKEIIEACEKFNLKLVGWYDIFIKPIDEYISLPSLKDNTLTFVLSDFLAHLPFGMFHPQIKGTNDVSLIERFPISIAPSIQVVSLLKEMKKSENEEVLLVCPIKKQSKDILYANSEVRRVKNILTSRASQSKGVSSDKIHDLIGDDATIPSFKNEAASAKWIHLACHTTIENKPANEPYSIFEGIFHLSPSTHDQGDLDSKAISDMRLDADLVFMSSCDSGRGNLKQEGSIGPLWSFLAAGAKSTVASYWRFPDLKETAEMIDEFYKTLKDLSKEPNAKVKALQKAIIAAKKHDNLKLWGALYLSGLPG